MDDGVELAALGNLVPEGVHAVQDGGDLVVAARWVLNAQRPVRGVTISQLLSVAEAQLRTR
jgi:hypothetical protein